MNIKQTVVLVVSFFMMIVGSIAMSTAVFAACSSTSVSECLSAETCAANGGSFVSNGSRGSCVPKDSSAAANSNTANQTCGEAETVIIKCTNTTNVQCTDGDACIEKNPIWNILIQAIQILTGGIGIAAVGGIVYGAILYTSAGGSTDQTKKAVTIITNVIIGLIAYVFMYALLNYIIPGGLF